MCLCSVLMLQYGSGTESCQWSHATVGDKNFPLFHPVEHCLRQLDKGTLVLAFFISGEGFNCLASMFPCKVSCLLKAPRLTEKSQQQRERGQWRVQGSGLLQQVYLKIKLLNC